MASIDINTSLAAVNETSEPGRNFGSVSLTLIDEDTSDNTYIEARRDAVVRVDPALSDYLSYTVTGTSIAFTNIRPIDFDDPDTPKSFSFTVSFDVDKVVVRDGAPTYTDFKEITKTYDIKIADVNDETPSDFQLSRSSIAETALPGKEIGQLYAYDPDRGDVLGYQLLDDPSGKFEIIGTRLFLKAGATLDYETTSSYDVTVKVRDAAAHEVVKTFTIAVDDVAEDPTDITLNGTSIRELAADGTVVGTLSGLDPDNDPSSLTYVSNSKLFVVEGDKLVLADGAKINYEMRSQYDVKITATDPDGGRYFEFFSIKIENEIEHRGSKNADDPSGDGSGEEFYTYGGDDDISAGGGDDWIVGGKGVDRIFGGSGADTFVFESFGQFGDILKDFESGEDTFGFTAAIATKMRFDDVTLFVNETVTGSGPTLDYRTDTGQLIFDADGAGRKHGVLIATLLDQDLFQQGVQAGVASLTMDDFFKIV